MTDKLKSRKLWITVLVGTLVLLARELGLDPGQVEHLIYLALAYIGVEGAIDTVRVHALRGESPPLTPPEAEP